MHSEITSEKSSCHFMFITVAGQNAQISVESLPHHCELNYTSVKRSLVPRVAILDWIWLSWLACKLVSVSPVFSLTGGVVFLSWGVLTCLPLLVPHCRHCASQRGANVHPVTLLLYSIVLAPRPPHPGCHSADRCWTLQIPSKGRPSGEELVHGAGLGWDGVAGGSTC